VQRIASAYVLTSKPNKNQNSARPLFSSRRAGDCKDILIWRRHTNQSLDNDQTSSDVVFHANHSREWVVKFTIIWSDLDLRPSNTGRALVPAIVSSFDSFRSRPAQRKVNFRQRFSFEHYRPQCKSLLGAARRNSQQHNVKAWPGPGASKLCQALEAGAVTFAAEVISDRISNNRSGICSAD
jgi:hypothetical protein